MKGLIDKADEMSLGDLVTEVLEKTDIRLIRSLGEEGEERLENVKELVSSVIDTSRSARKKRRLLPDFSRAYPL